MASLKNHKTYSYYKSAFRGELYPLLYLDMDLFLLNIKGVLDRSGDKTVRIASKSLRCRYVMDFILKYNDGFVGIMCYSPMEACWLSKLGYDDLLIAYPTSTKHMVEAVADEMINCPTRNIYMTVDNEDHLKIIDIVAATRDIVMSVCVDLDMSTVFPGIYFGVHRSSISNLVQLEHFLDAFEKYKHLKLVGVLAYEAQVAGLGDRNNGSIFLDFIVRQLKKLSISIIAQRRRDMVNLITSRGHSLSFVNGGGTGSLSSTCKDPTVTEVTVGSAFYCPTLFDAYDDFSYHPACGFAVEITRHPQRGVYTCAGGGYVASGSVGTSKLPQVHLPPQCTLDVNEMAGEVQTPVHVQSYSWWYVIIYLIKRLYIYSTINIRKTVHKCVGDPCSPHGGADGIAYLGGSNFKGDDNCHGTELGLGDPVLMRHSKGGEVCERFLDMKIISRGTIVERVLTYRGEGVCFL